MHSRISFNFPLLLTLCAFALRLWRIDAQALRGDEAFDVLFALQPIDEIIYQDRFNQIYPPLYHVLDHYWLWLAGLPELSARFIAFAAGVLLTPLTYRLAQRLLATPTAQLAALLVALHPFLIWHSQDGRMYTLLAACSLASALFALTLWEHGTMAKGQATKAHLTLNIKAPRRHPPYASWLLYIFVSSLNVLNHYFAYFAIFAINLVALFLWWRLRWRFSFYARWFMANVAVGIVAFTWVALAWARVSGHSEPWITPVSPLDVLSRSLMAYSLGTTIAWSQAWLFLLAFVVLLLIAFSRKRQALETGNRALGLCPLKGLRIWNLEFGIWNLGFVSVTLLCFIPLITIYLGSLFRPMYDEKFLIFIVPFYLMLIAHGLTALPARLQLRMGALLLIALGMALTLANAHFDPQFAKAPPWRDVAQRISADLRAGDVVVYNYPDPALPYQFKIRNALPEDRLVLLPAQGPGDPAVAKPLDPTTIDMALAQLSARYERIWFVPQPTFNWDSVGHVERWLTRHTDRDFESTFASLKLQRYLTPQAYHKLWTPINADFADNLRLLAYRSESTASAIQLTLYWQATGRITKDYTVFTHLLDATGFLRAQQDNPPVNGTYPTTAWQTSTVIVDRYAIITPPDLPIGRYRFAVGLYDASGARLRVGSTDQVVFGEFVK